MALLHMTWQPQTQQQRRRKGSPPLGLKNLGNSCYLNSVLQCLTYTPPLAQYCLSFHHSSLCKSVVSNRDKECPFCILERRIARSLSLEGSIVDSPSKIQKCITLFAEHFRWGRQEDAHEFLRYVIDACHNTCLKLLKKTPAASNGTQTAEGPSSVMKDVFGGELLSQVKCLSCKGESNKTDEIMDISLDLFQTNSLRDALARFFQPELLDGNNKYNCSKCKKLSVAKKQMFILRAPNVLVIQLKRFEGVHGGKINRNIEFEEVLLLSKFMSSTNQDLHPEYNLFGSIVHSGFSPESGHYYAYIKDPSGRWYCCNDANVSLSSTQEVMSEKVYILFYLRNSQNPRSSKTGFPCSSMPSDSNGSSVSPNQKSAEKPPTVRLNGVSSSKDSASTTLRNGKIATNALFKPVTFKDLEMNKVITNGNGKHEVHSNGSVENTNCKPSTIKKSIHANGSMENTKTEKNAELTSENDVADRESSDTLSKHTKKMLLVPNGNGHINLLKENAHEDNKSTQSSAAVKRDIECSHLSDDVLSENVSAMTVLKRKLSNTERGDGLDIHSKEPCCSSLNNASLRTQIPPRTNCSEELENFKEVISSEAASDLQSCGWVDRVHDFMSTRKRLCMQENGCPDKTELRRQLINDAKKIFNSQIPESLKEHLVERLRSFSQGKPLHDA